MHPEVLSPSSVRADYAMDVDVPALLALHVVHGIHSFRDLLRQTSLLAQKTVIDA